MNVEMAYLEIVGMKTHLQGTIRTLYHLGCIQIDEITDSPEVLAQPLAMDPKTLSTQEKLSLLAAQVEGLLDILGDSSPSGSVDRVLDCPTKARVGMATLMPKVRVLTTRRAELIDELDSLPRYENTLRKLVPIIPASIHEPGNMSVGVMVNRANIGVMDMIGKQVLELTGGRAELLTTVVDASTQVMLIVFPKKFADEIESLLGREDISRLRLPSSLAEGSPEVAIMSLHCRLAAIPAELEDIEIKLTELAAQWGERLAAWRDTLRDELEAYHVLSRLGETDMTFVLAGWCPAKDVERVKATLREEVGEPILVHRLPLTKEMKKRAPVVLQNPLPARPFESLVRLLSLPRYGRLDPTCLMAFFLPIFFGMMLGDVGYGVLLLALSVGLLLKFKAGIARDFLFVLAMGAGWTIVFGVLFGEAFGTLGEHLGMHALWFDRASPQHIAGLLLMTLAVGAVHILLGLLLGVWEAIRDRSRGHVLERGGMLVGLVALFSIVGVLVGFLPAGFMTPGIAALIVGIVLIGASLGWLGVLMGPIEFLGLIGNVLSYLRLAAIGLASIYLAKVANDIAGLIGNLIVGVIVAVLLHSLNLVMGAFSPTIHSLRLHYVEFFRKFYQGGSRPYEPFRSQLFSDTNTQ